jgi:hypothetical protein
VNPAIVRAADEGMGCGSEEPRLYRVPVERRRARKTSNPSNSQCPIYAGTSAHTHDATLLRCPSATFFPSYCAALGATREVRELRSHTRTASVEPRAAVSVSRDASATLSARPHTSDAWLAERDTCCAISLVFVNLLNHRDVSPIAVLAFEVLAWIDVTLLPISSVAAAVS